MNYQRGQLRKKIPFTTDSKRIKYIGINLTKDVKDLYSENYKTLNKESEEDTNRWKHIPCSWIRSIHIITVSILLQAIYRFRTSPMKTPMVYFA